MVTIISGGQSGVDRAALDAAIGLGLPYGGWCPKGGWAEDLPEPPGVLALYPQLRPTPEADPVQRTEWNVRDSDRLMVLTDDAGLAVSQGTRLALRCAEVLGKPHMVVGLDAPKALNQARAWREAGRGERLCVAGPRESEAPGIYEQAKIFLTTLLRR